MAVLHPGPVLHMEKRSGRLRALRDKNDHGEHRKNDQHHRHRDGEINRAFQKTIHRIFERFLAQPDKAEAAVLKMGNGMPQSFFQVAQNHKANA
jgi:hypothetical protein